MKTTTISFMAAVLVFAGFCAFAGIEASGAPEPRSKLREMPVVSRLDQEESHPDAMNHEVEHLAAYTLDVMHSWPPALIPAADYEPLAHAIAEASLEKPSPEPAADAVLLASLGYIEGARYAEYVASWKCNDEDWRKYGNEIGSSHMSRFEDGNTSLFVASHRTDLWTAQELMHVGGDCDGGRAHGVFQLWYAIDSASPLYAFCSKEALTSWRAEARCALEIARTDSSLCGYAGEHASEGCPKGDLRRRFALDALAKHPFTALPKE